jgi:ATP-dependent DNA helicase RecG
MPIAQEPLHARPIRYVKGVGPHRMAQLAALGIETVEDACYYPPRRYEDRTRLAAIAEAVPGEVVTVRGRVAATSLRRARRGQAIFEAAVTDGSGTLNAVWFHSAFLAQQIRVGDHLILYGRLELKPRPQMVHPEVEPVEADEDGSLHTGRIVPVYALTEGVNQRWFRRLIAAVVQEHAEALEDVLPEALRRARGWPPVAAAVRELHFPTALPAMEAARDRLAFEELFLLQLALVERRARTLARQKPQRYQIPGPVTEGLRAGLPFTLTPAQERVLQELLGDLQQPAPMYRLLQGDVGCGKTIVLVFLAAAAVQSGYQAALMAPTELLAEQHGRSLRALLEPLGVRVGVLSQGVPAAERRRVLAEAAAGGLGVVIGTHALLERPVAFRRLALVIIDEQHKFGVAQRARLASKAQVPDVLVLTATPIPRTLALSLYGDLAVSTIAEMPPGRTPVQTRWVREAQRPELYERMRRELEAGRQGYVVYPLVAEQPAREIKAATQMAKRLQADVFPGQRVGLLHGQMKPAQKEATMQAFARGDLGLLVSTVIVEVGLDVPNATMMVIEHPERFGLAQLHQLRGRIGRGRHAAWCAVVSDTAEEPARQRLEAFIGTTNGFELAERDLTLRGPGQLLGRRQHGWFRFRVADLGRDRLLLEEARQEAEALLARDPALRDAGLAPARARLERLRRQPG